MKSVNYPPLAASKITAVLMNYEKNVSVTVDSRMSLFRLYPIFWTSKVEMTFKIILRTVMHPDIDDLNTKLFL